MRTRQTPPRWLFVALLLGAGALPLRAQAIPDTTKPYLTIGVALGQVEEGARLFTPIRLLPFAHPEAQGHEFPTVQQFHVRELDALTALGERSGLKLRTTLLRYPRWPADAWAFPGFREMPADTVAGAAVLRLPADRAPLPGLRAAAFLDGFPLCFLLDTRGLTLAERGMDRPTAMGLDVTRSDLLEALKQAAAAAPDEGAFVVIFEPEQE